MLNDVPHSLSQHTPTPSQHALALSEVPLTLSEHTPWLSQTPFVLSDIPHSLSQHTPMLSVAATSGVSTPTRYESAHPFLKIAPRHATRGFSKSQRNLWHLLLNTSYPQAPQPLHLIILLNLSKSLHYFSSA